MSETQAVLSLSAVRADEALATCWRIDSLDSVGELVAGTVPVAVAAR